MAGDLGLTSGCVMSLSGDKQRALQMAKEARTSGASKHIAIYYHLIRDKVERGKILLKYVPSMDNVADIFTKCSRDQLHNAIYRSKVNDMGL